MVDGDGTYSADSAKLLYESYLCNPCDTITGVRDFSEIRNHRPFHVFGTKFFSSLVSAVVGGSESDVFSGLRLFSRRFYKLVPVLARGFDLEIELTFHAYDKGFSTRNVDIPYYERVLGGVSKLRTIRDGTIILFTLMRLVRDFKPFIFFLCFAIFFSILGLVAGYFPVRAYVETGYVNRVPLAILAASLQMISVVLLVAGIILESGLRCHRERFEIEMRNFIA
jgi:hypothetical protein